MGQFPSLSRRDFLGACRYLGGASLTLPLLSHAQGLEPGDAAPALDLPGAPGRVQLSNLKGKVVYLDFWASWCGPCRKSFPWMNELQRKYADQGLVVVGVNLDAKPDDAQAFLQRTPAEFRLAFDPQGESPRRFGVKGMPTSFIIHRNGQVAHKHTGFTDKTAREAEEHIVALLKKTP